MDCKHIDNGSVTLGKGECAEIVTPDLSKKVVGKITVNSCGKDGGTKYKANVIVEYNGKKKILDLMQTTSVFFEDLTIRLESGSEKGAQVGITLNVLFDAQ